MVELRTQKCSRCKTLRKPSNFIYKEKEHKTCIVCSERTKKYRDKKRDKTQYNKILNIMQTLEIG